MAKLIAVVGMPGSGKGEVVTYLTSQFDYRLIYFGGTVINLLKDQGLEVNETNERSIREQLRQQHGMAAMAILNLPAIREKLAKGENVVIDGLYSWQEYLILRTEFPDMVELAVWAPPELRYQRLATRPERPLTREQAISRDYAQLENLHTGGPIAMADVMVCNDSTLDDLHQTIDFEIGVVRA